jgi:hypothetical protein
VEAAEEAACTLFELAATHGAFLMRHEYHQVAAATLLSNDTPSDRLQELLLGSLANLACAAHVATAFATDAAIVLAIVGAGVCGAEEPAALAEACRALRACVSAPGAAGATFRDAAFSHGAVARLVSVLASARHAPLLQRAADAITALAVAGGASARELLLSSSALPAALAALGSLPRMRGGDATLAADAAARCIEALTSDGAAAAETLSAALTDGSLPSAMLPPLAQEDAPALAASVCIALSCVLAALRDAADDADGDADAVHSACAAIEALLRALAAHAGALAALRSLAAGGTWGGADEGAAQAAAQELLDALAAASAPEADAAPT